MHAVFLMEVIQVVRGLDYTLPYTLTKYKKKLTRIKKENDVHS